MGEAVLHAQSFRLARKLLREKHTQFVVKGYTYRHAAVTATYSIERVYQNGITVERQRGRWDVLA